MLQKGSFSKSSLKAVEVSINVLGSYILPYLCSKKLLGFCGLLGHVVAAVLQFSMESFGGFIIVVDFLYRQSTSR